MNPAAPSRPNTSTPASANPRGRAAPAIPATMRAAVVDAAGPAEGLVITTVPTPRPGPGEVLIQVHSAGVNFSDVKRRRGDVYPFPTSFPYTPGGEVAGVVVAVGVGAERFALGDRVCALVGKDGSGGAAEYAVAGAHAVVPLPPHIDDDNGAVVLIAGVTAHLMLESAEVQAGDRVLIPAATGGVGSFAVAMAKGRGAHVVALVGSDDKRASAERLGADAVVVMRGDWAAQVAADGGVDVAFEATGGAALEETLTTLKAHGRCVVIGAASGVNGTLSAAALERLLYAPAANQRLQAFNLGVWFMNRPDVAGAGIGAVLGGLASGALRAPSITTLPLDDVAKAHRRLESRAVRGKLVLKP